MADYGVLRAIGKAIKAAFDPLIDVFNMPSRRELVIALELEPREDVGPLPIAELEAASAKLGEIEDAFELMEGITAAITLLEQPIQILAHAGDTDVAKEAVLRALEVVGTTRVRQRYPIPYAGARALGVLSDDLLRIDWDRAGDVFTRLLVPRPPDSEPVPIDAVVMQAWFAVASILLGHGFGADEIDWLYGWDPDPTILDNPAQQVSERSLTVAFRERSADGGVAAEALISSAFVPPEHRGPAVVLGLGGAIELEHPPGARFRLSAPSAATLFIPLPGSPERFRIEGGDAVAFDIRRPPSDTKIVFPGETTRGRLELGGVAVAGGLVADDLAFELTVGDAALVINPKRDEDEDEDEDKDKDKPAEPGSELLEGPTRIPFAFSIGWTASRGFYMAGGTPLGFTRPTPWLKLKGLRFNHVRGELAPPGGDAGRSLGIDLTTSASLDVGSYFHMTVDRLGVGLKVHWDHAVGVDLDRFISPNGIGLRVDFKAFKGGGMLVLDRERGEYAGAFEVALDLWRLDFTLKAIVLYTTKIEGRSEGALLVSVSMSDFRWELGWGFSVTGIGGMIASGHGYDLPALRDGLRTGALEHVMFPDDPVRNAPRIFQTLRTVFPLEPGATTAALFFEISWGLGDVVKIRLGALGRWRPGADDRELVLIGSFDLALPARPDEVLVIHVDALGVINWTDGTEVSIDAQLRDSHLLGIPLTGSLALRVRSGGSREPMFLLSIGGFHPQFPPPPANVVPRLDRVGFRLEKSILRLSAEIYFAIAAATMQFGVRADLVARGLGLRFEATFALDVIVDTGTYRFVAELQARAALKRGSSTLMGVDFYGRWEGTSPSRLSGKVTFKIWFIKKSIPFNEPLATGEVQQALVDARELLVAELESPRNWNGAMPSEGRRLISIDPVASGDGVVVVHPLGELGVRQAVLPLRLELDKLGAARLSGERRFVISRLSGMGADALEDVTDHFAAAQFLDLDEAAALSQPGFERMPAGVRARSDAVVAGTGRRRPVLYETIVIPVDHRPPPEPPAPEEPQPPKSRFDVLGQFWAAAATERSARGAPLNFEAAPERRVELRPEGYVLVGDDLTRVDEAAHRSFHLARQELAREGVAQVVGAHEVRGG